MCPTSVVHRSLELGPFDEIGSNILHLSLLLILHIEVEFHMALCLFLCSIQVPTDLALAIVKWVLFVF
jgi:hypothetical protein